MYYVYIVASKRRTLYIGFTGDLRKRIWQHKTHAHEGFTHTYNCDQLVHVEVFAEALEGIAREKQLKGWLRRKKIQLIQSQNADWTDLAADWFEPKDVMKARILNGDPRVDAEPFGG
jgi:putative endonuclease